MVRNKTYCIASSNPKLNAASDLERWEQNIIAKERVEIVTVSVPVFAFCSSHQCK